MASSVLLIAPALLLMGCGSEIGRIPFHDAGSGDAQVTLGASDSIALWTQLDVQFSGDLGAIYDVSLIDDQGRPPARSSAIRSASGRA